MGIHRLPKYIRPIKYRIRIEPMGPDYEKFKGSCYIIFTNNGDHKDIIINALDLEIGDVYLVDKNIIYHNTGIEYNHDREHVKLSFDMIPREGMMVIEYIGKILAEAPGFYRAKENDEWIFCTNFEPTFARKCFPCFDEPALKAKFNIEIVAPKNKKVLSNTDVKDKINLAGKILHIFHETPLMSTYLVAFYIGNINFSEGMSSSGVKIRIFDNHTEKIRKELLEEAIRSVDILEKFFNYPYPMPKLDIVYVPILKAEAMENWGLIACISFDNDNLGLLEKIDNIYTIYHEISHQWIGDLVTMHWWSDIWLNESFAVWFEKYQMSIIHPEWKPFEDLFMSETLKAFGKDCLDSSHPLVVNVETPTEIDEIFDTLSYGKGACIVNMIVTYMGITKFQKGMQMYIEKYQYSNVTTKNFLECMEDSSSIPILEYFGKWTEVNNYPIVNVLPLEIIQEPYILPKKQSDKLWYIPLTNNFLLTDKKEMLVLDNMINKNMFGFYLVNYHPTILEKILSNKLNNLDIAGLINNLFMCLQMGKFPFDVYLKFLEIIVERIKKNQPSGVIAVVMKKHYRYFNYIVKNSVAIIQYNNIMIKYIHNVLGKIGLEYSNNDDMDMIISRTHAIKIAYLANIPEYVQVFDKLFIKFMNALSAKQKNAINTINYNIRTTVLKNAIMNVNEGERNKNFDFLFRFFNNDPLILIPVITATPNLTNYLRALELIFSDVLKKNDKIYFLISAGENKFFNKHLWEFIKNNWDFIYEIFTNTEIPLTRIINVFNFMVDDNTLRKDIKAFFTEKNISDVGKPLEKILEKITNNTNFNNLF